MGYQCIVCGVTGSIHAQKAALEAAALAKKDDARLVFVYAVDASFLGQSLMAEVSQGHVETSLLRLGDHILAHAEELVAPLGIVPEKIVRMGAPLEVIEQVIREEKGDLLVVGHEERTRFERNLVKGEVEKHVDVLKKATGANVMVVSKEGSHG